MKGGEKRKDGEMKGKIKWIVRQERDGAGGRRKTGTIHTKRDAESDMEGVIGETL